jgi:AcrR family transcriptional regulator
MPEAAETNSTEAAPLASVPTAIGTRQTILATAQRLFGERGYDATSLRQIADAVGMTKAAVYYHYPAKEHMLLELTRPMLDGLSELVATLRADERQVDSDAALECYLDLFVEHVDVLRMLGQDPSTMHHPDIGQRIRRLVEAITLAIAGPDPDSEHLVRTGCAMGVVHSVSQLAPDTVRQHRATILTSAKAALDAGA